MSYDEGGLGTEAEGYHIVNLESILMAARFWGVGINTTTKNLIETGQNGP